MNTAHVTVTMAALEKMLGLAMVAAASARTTLNAAETTLRNARETSQKADAAVHHLEEKIRELVLGDPS